MQAVAGDVRRRRPKVVLGFLGCMAQVRGQALQEQLPDVDLILGTRRFHRAVDYLDDLLAGKRAKVCDVAEEPNSHGPLLEHLSAVPGGERPVTAFVNIMQGCNQYCTFCIVPLTRGQERCRPIAEIVAEVQARVAQGVKEVTLLGQIVTSYGRQEISQRDGKSPFVQLLEAVEAVEGLERIRFTAPHPKGYGDDLVEAYGRLPKLCESAHLPAQSGSNRILKLMRRGYTAERVLELAGKLRRMQPQMGITTDFIVGFPGETEADFEDTLALARAVQFDSAYLFKYSPRKNTPAAVLPDQAPPEIKEARHARLMQSLNEITARKYQQFVGKHAQVLVEGPSHKNPARLTGRTRCNKIVVFDGSPRQRGQLLDVRITRAGKYTLYGDSAWINLD
jgi:tRNA-2-methylthio-N6-dimethylallyladenosine synthase